MLIKDRLLIYKLTNYDYCLWMGFRMKWQLLCVLITLCFIACEPITPQTEVDQNTLDSSLTDLGTVVERDRSISVEADLATAGTMVVDSEMSSADMMTEDQDVRDQTINLSDSELDQEAPMDSEVLDAEVLVDMDGDMDRPDMEMIETSVPVRAPCFLANIIETGLEQAPQSCSELFQRAPDLESGCYNFIESDGELSQAYCWRHRGLVFLLNNELESDTHPEDLDENGVIDQGDLAGTNFPADPFPLNPAEVAGRLQREVRSFFKEISYGSLIIDLEVYWAGEGTTERTEEPSEEVLDLEQWYRLRVLRPSFANHNLVQDLCQRRGGMTAADWRVYDFIATVISHGTSTSGSQFRRESLPTGINCDQNAIVATDYIVAKNFRFWNRLGTFFHEITHALSRDPFQEPSIGHSEATHARTGQNANYGDMTDLMGRSSTRGHLSGPQKAFLRYLPTELIQRVPLDEVITNARLSPLEPSSMIIAEKRLLQIEVNQGMNYHVEVRRNIGEDARLDPIFFQGALIKRAKVLNEANKSFMIDPTPETPTNASDDSVLFPQRTFTDESNQLHISALESDDQGVSLVVRRGPRSSLAPVVDNVEVVTEQGSNGEISARLLTASASSQEANVAAGDLLYFWKLGERDTLYSPSSYRTGSSIRLSANQRPREIWLIVSDQRGGETWHLVREMEMNAPVCGDGVMNGDEECDDGNQVTETCSHSEQACMVCSEDCTLVAGQLCPAPPQEPSPLGPDCTDTCDCIEEYNYTRNQANNGVCEVYSYPVHEEYCCSYGTDCSDCQGRGQPPVRPPCQAGTAGVGGQGLLDSSVCTDACCPGVRWRYPLDPPSLRPDQLPEICDDCSWSVEEDSCGRITDYWIYGSFNSFQGFSNCSQREIDADRRRCQYSFEYNAAGNVTREDETCYSGIEANMIEHWLHSYDEQGRRTQSEHWYETDAYITRTLVQFQYDEQNRVSLETTQNIPLSQDGFDRLGEIPEDLLPTRSRSFVYEACNITVLLDEGVDGIIDSQESIYYPDWW